jgi:hypothetical protein
MAPASEFTRSWNKGVTHSDLPLDVEIRRMHDLTLHQLRTLWLTQIGRLPKHQSADLIRRRLAYELQARRYGGLRPDIRRRLRQLYQALKADPNHLPLSNYNLKEGTVLTKVWRGATHKVGVLAEGFEYQGHRYKSLSDVAQRITGAKRSGPAFFGFREPKR